MFIIDSFLIWLARELEKIAEQEKRDDESKLKEELLRIRTLYEIDQVTEEEYKKREDEILRRLDVVYRERKVEKSGTSERKPWETTRVVHVPITKIR